jgi:hypothetical protein
MTAGNAIFTNKLPVVDLIEARVIVVVLVVAVAIQVAAIQQT